MKKLAPRPYLLFVMVLPLLSCADDNVRTDGPAPTMHDVKVRYTGAKLSGLGAYVNAGCNKEDGSGTATNMNSDIADASVQGTIRSYKVPTSKDYYVTLAFKQVKAGTRAPRGAYLKADILVDDVLRKSIQIDNTTAPGAQYVLDQATVQHDEW
ncbi:hypothetical protein [Hymenobacter crusticola]|uniref:Lipoprotein n=1 Tax=Hymenobacter crusticola TaxID=1770526 RepID=A0A243W9A8_9BACT|nr:hypothetical protein [Hymenobacter crusticola]OUJ71794.1 hypothetical protein BXP70_20805 [Hymenobacter crusticola]